MPVDLVPLLVNASIRAFGLGLAAFAGFLLFRTRSSAARHAMWTVVLAGMLLQIPLGVLAPTIPLRTLPTLRTPIQPRVTESARISVPAPAPAPMIRTPTEPKASRVAWKETLTGVYFSISMLLFLRMAFGSWGLRRILQDARPVPKLGPGIFESVLFVVPGSVGCFRSRIVLPQAWKDWDPVKLRAVLAHERAHVRRRDWLILVASHVNICIFWFHPLAWWMERELARLAEEACDDVAVSEMEDREEYAATLVDVARAAGAHGGILNWRAIPMAHGSKVMGRVNRILNRRLPVPKPFGRLAWVTLFACGLPVIYLSAAVKLAPSNRPVRMIAQAAPNNATPNAATPNQLVRPAPPLTPSRHEDSPITICILIDNSGSMRDKRAEVKAAALALVKASKPYDAVCIVNFNDEVFNGLPHGEDFTSDIKEMEEALTHIDSRGGSAMREAVRMSIDQVEQAAHDTRKVLVLVTDGDDNASAITQEQLLNRIRDSGVRVYGMGLLSENDSRQATAAMPALRQLAEASGSVAYYPRDLAEVESISREIANEARKQ
jgi:Mg-chelatase subunit ChlD